MTTERPRPTPAVMPTVRKVPPRGVPGRYWNLCRKWADGQWKEG